jgi:hypothetical protein
MSHFGSLNSGEEVGIMFVGTVSSAGGDGTSICDEEDI